MKNLKTIIWSIISFLSMCGMIWASSINVFAIISPPILKNEVPLLEGSRLCLVGSEDDQYDTLGRFSNDVIIGYIPYNTNFISGSFIYDASSVHYMYYMVLDYNDIQHSIRCIAYSPIQYSDTYAFGVLTIQFDGTNTLPFSINEDIDVSSWCLLWRLPYCWINQNISDSSYTLVQWISYSSTVYNLMLSTNLSSWDLWHSTTGELDSSIMSIALPDYDRLFFKLETYNP